MDFTRLQELLPHPEQAAKVIPSQLNIAGDLQTWDSKLLSLLHSALLHFLSSLPLSLQACPCQRTHRGRLNLQVHPGSPLRVSTRAGGVWGAETPDPGLHQAGPQLRAGAAESGGGRWELLEGHFEEFFWIFFTSAPESHSSSVPLLISRLLSTQDGWTRAQKIW